VQVLNRVGWDGFIRLPDDNELGWKDTVRISPLEDTIVAFRPVTPRVPFPLPNSIRPLHPAMPMGSTEGFSQINTTDGGALNPLQTNQMTNFGHEYAWHCHILSHEENDMMRPLVLNTDQLLYVANSGTGIAQWDMGTWSQVTSANPQLMAASGSMLYGAYTNGIWKYDGSTWIQATPYAPQLMAASGNALYADFAGTGIWKYDGSTWIQATPYSPQLMAASGSMLYGNYTNGIWKYDGSTWIQATPYAPQLMAASGSILYGAYTNGIWKYNGSTWVQITSNNPQLMVASGNALYADFAGTGIWKWEANTWIRLTPTDPVEMVAGF
jgi:hypothetical protein